MYNVYMYVGTYLYIVEKMSSKYFKSIHQKKKLQFHNTLPSVALLEMICKSKPQGYLSKHFYV